MHHQRHHPLLTRRGLLHAGAAAACGWAALPARACEFFGPTLRVTHPWTRATPDDATSAVVCMVFDEITQDDRLVGLQTAYATGAEMVVDGQATAINLPLPSGQVHTLTETGTHLRLTGLTQPLGLGRAYPIRLLFAQGGLMRAELLVDFPPSGTLTRFR